MESDIEKSADKEPLLDNRVVQWGLRTVNFIGFASTISYCTLEIAGVKGVNWLAVTAATCGTLAILSCTRYSRVLERRITLLRSELSAERMNSVLYEVSASRLSREVERQQSELRITEATKGENNKALMDCLSAIGNRLAVGSNPDDRTTIGEWAIRLAKGGCILLVMEANRMIPKCRTDQRDQWIISVLRFIGVFAVTPESYKRESTSFLAAIQPSLGVAKAVIDGGIEPNCRPTLAVGIKWLMDLHSRVNEAFVREFVASIPKGTEPPT